MGQHGGVGGDLVEAGDGAKAARGASASVSSLEPTGFGCLFSALALLVANTLEFAVTPCSLITLF